MDRYIYRRPGMVRLKGANMLTKIIKFCKHNLGICTGVPLCFIIIVWCYSCQSTVQSLTPPYRQVTRAELYADVNDYLARAALKFKDLDRQDLVKGTIFNHALDLLQTGKIDPFSLMAVLGNIMGLGAVIDNVRKRTLIATLKSQNPGNNKNSTDSA